MIDQKADRTLTVVAAGPQLTVQDLGRPGHAHLGVPRSGALDGPALRLANRLVGNDEGAAGLESLGGRPDPEAMTGQCPDCQVDLVRVEGGDRHHPVFYDTCESCGGILLESEFDDTDDPKVLIQEIVGFFQRFSAKKKNLTA